MTKIRTKFTYKLKVPFTHNGHEIKEISLRRPTLDDHLQAIERSGSDKPEAQVKYLYSAISGLSPEEVGRIDFYMDWPAFMEESSLFFGGSLSKQAT